MAYVAVSYWIPRSPQHLSEVAGLLDKLELKTESINLCDNLEFTLEKDGETYRALFSSYGLFTLSTKIGKDSVGEDDLHHIRGKAEEILFHDILEKIQPITYHQIAKGMLPANFHMTVYTCGECPGELDCVESNGIKVYFNKAEKYRPDSKVYVYGDPDPEISGVLNLYSYTVLASKYLGDVVVEFGEIYRRLEEVEAMTEEEDFDILKKLITETDKVKKECSERNGKLIQAYNTIRHARKIFEDNVSGSSYAGVHEDMEVGKAFDRLEYDFDYISPLWKDVLLNTIENLDFMVNARFELQESLETRKEEKEMKLLQAIFLVGVISSILALGAMPGATLTLYSPDGALLAEGSLVSFKITDLVSFGVIAIFVSVFFFMLFNYLYLNFGKLTGRKTDD